MLRSKFGKELAILQADLNTMCYGVTMAIEECITAFKTQDKQLAKNIILNDKKINEMELKIEARCLSLILKQQPIATDLRNVTTALKIVTDLERIGDQSADIAKILLTLHGDSMYRMVEHIPNMASIAKAMVKESIDAFNEGDVDKATKIKEKDDTLDSYFVIVKDEVSTIIRETPDNSDLGIDFLMIAKYFERIGDHAVNICEWIEFNQTGIFNDHRLL